MMKNVSTSKMSFPTLEEFEQKCEEGQEMPTEVNYRMEKVGQITRKSERVTMVVSLVDEDGTSFKSFPTGCLENDLRDFG